MVFCPTKRPLEFDRRICTEQSDTAGLNLTKPRYKKRPRLKFGLRSGAAAKAGRKRKSKFKCRAQPPATQARLNLGAKRSASGSRRQTRQKRSRSPKPTKTEAGSRQIFKFYALFRCFRYLSKCGRFLKSQAPLRLRNRANFTSAASANSSPDNTLPA